LCIAKIISNPVKTGRWSWWLDVMQGTCCVMCLCHQYGDCLSIEGQSIVDCTHHQCGPTQSINSYYKNLFR